VLLLFSVSALIYPSTSISLHVANKTTMNEAKKDEVVQLEDAGDTFVCCPSFLTIAIRYMT
jgi:hypothetical protein